MSLKVIAVSAPEYPFGRIGTTSLTSRDPVSLYNACRLAAFLADNMLGQWGDSNWAVSRKERRKKLLLMNSFLEEKSYFEELLAKESPNLLLIGSMTMCFPGAIECAKLARQMFGKEIFIVLGGRHSNETVYTDKKRNCVKHHNGSPLKLMAENKIDDNTFDLVVSGEGEFVIAKIGEIISNLPHNCDTDSLVVLQGISKLPGNWVAGCAYNGKIETVISENIPFDRNQLPSPAKMFGVGCGFDVFQGALTGHVFSNMSSGCIYNCAFCSERNSVCGPLIQSETSSSRLFRQLMDVHDVIIEDEPGRKVSAFIEDSIILGGLESQLLKLNGMLEAHPVDMKFGGQLTIDIAIKQKDIIKELASKGLEYIFAGIETFDPGAVGGMSKNIGKNKWIDRSEKMIEEYTKMGIKIGLSVLFGLGENQNQRMLLLKRISHWKNKYGNPVILSSNWAFQHPLKGEDNGAGFDYLDWAINDQLYISAFKNFGEASVKYPICGISLPTLEEIFEIQKLI